MQASVGHCKLLVESVVDCACGSVAARIQWVHGRATISGESALERRIYVNDTASTSQTLGSRAETPDCLDFACEAHIVFRQQVRCLDVNIAATAARETIIRLTTRVGFCVCLNCSV